LITKKKASRLEGSFGTDKAYFILNKLKLEPRNQKSYGFLWASMHPIRSLLAVE